MITAGWRPDDLETGMVNLESDLKICLLLSGHNPPNSPGTPNSYTQNEKENENKLFDLAEKRYNFELQRIKDLDSKAGNLVGYVGIVTSLIIGLGTFNLLGKLSTPGYYALYFGGIIALASSIFFSVWAIKVRKFRFNPQRSDIMHFYNNPSIEYRILLRTNIFEMSKAFYENWETNNKKGMWILISLICFIAGILLLLSYAGVYTYDHEILNSSRIQNTTKIVYQLDNTTFKQLISGAHINFSPSDTIEVKSASLPEDKFILDGNTIPVVKK